ncbi:hypothetical protein GAO09_00610 [Rhizobiales bacterium RZME27]|uniref:Uncharacterized protein n=2 Tax=Rhizobiaceae TaxID=82115 RepID=A0A6A8A5N7_9HYPH|nr:hypothetical protein [Endobacterium cereale]MEB2843459.1 hypothetical protein [Endobacterium cereale]MQY44576.1 hypothetical protein [Endobacterium cereale]
MFAKKNSAMPDKITMISIVWTAMIAVMMTATVTLYNDKSDTAPTNYTEMTGTYQGVSYY